MPLDTIDAISHFKSIYNNCRSFHKHVRELKQHQSILSAHVIGLSKSRLCLKDDSRDYSIEGFNLVRNDQIMTSNLVRSSHGSVVYLRNDVDIDVKHKFNTNYLELTVIDCHHALIDMQVVVVYKSPGTSYETLARKLESELFPHVNKSKPIVVVGDFNIGRPVYY